MRADLQRPWDREWWRGDAIVEVPARVLDAPPSHLGAKRRRAEQLPERVGERGVVAERDGAWA